MSLYEISPSHGVLATDTHEQRPIDVAGLLSHLTPIWIVVFEFNIQICFKD